MAKPKHTVIEYRSYELPPQYPLMLLSGDYWKISDIPSNRLHFHNCLEIGICHSHSGELVLFDEPVPFQAGDVTVIPKNVPHTTYSTPGTESLWSYLFFDPEKLFRNMLPPSWKNADLSRHIGQGMQVVFGKNDYPQIYRLVMSAKRELEEQRPNYRLCAKCFLLALCIEITRSLSSEAVSTENAFSTPPERQYGSPAEEKPEKSNALSIAPALDFIEQNYQQQISMEYLADLCHWSQTHFRRVFQEIMRTSPLDFLNHTRISNACSLLQSTEDSILDISETVGFHSVSSFNRCFAKIMQMSPREYRKLAQTSAYRINSPYIIGYSGWTHPETPENS